MKKILIIVISLIMIFTLSACGNGDEKTPNFQPSVQIPEGATVYSGSVGASEATVALVDSGAWLFIYEKEEMPADDMAEAGLSGTLFAVMTIRFEFPEVTEKGGMLVLSGNSIKMYQSTSFSGTAAKKYTDMIKSRYEEAYKKEQITKEQYDQMIGFLSGKEILTEENGGSVEVNVKLTSKSTCLILNVDTTAPNGNRNILEYEYTDDGKVSKEAEYVCYMPNPMDGPYAEITTYYPDGKTVKTEEEYHLYVEEDGSFVLNESPRYTCEYRENGSRKTETYWLGLGTVSSVTEFDENDRVIKETYYTANGQEIERYITYTYSADTLIEKRYEGDVLVSETYREKDEEKANADPRWWYVVKYVTYDGEGGRTEKIFYPGAESEYHACKLYVEYDADGVEVRKVSYDENGSVTEEYVGGQLIGGSIDGTLPGDYSAEYESQGITWTTYYVAGAMWKETVTFTNGTTLTVTEKDSLGRYVIYYGYYGDGNGTITMLEVYKTVYVGDTNDIEAQSWVQYNVPNGAVAATSGSDVGNVGNGNGESKAKVVNYIRDGVEFTEYYVYGSCVKITAKFANGVTVCVRESDERGRDKIYYGVSLNEYDEITEIVVTECVYDGDNIKYEKTTEYSSPDGDIRNEYLIKN